VPGLPRARRTRWSRVAASLASLLLAGCNCVEREGELYTCSCTAIVDNTTVTQPFEVCEDQEKPYAEAYAEDRCYGATGDMECSCSCTEIGTCTVGTNPSCH
jgi:hypothetical protein